MVKKRLSDVVREEAKKSFDLEATETTSSSASKRSPQRPQTTAATKNTGRKKSVSLDQAEAMKEALEGLELEGSEMDEEDSVESEEQAAAVSPASSGRRTRSRSQATATKTTEPEADSISRSTSSSTRKSKAATSAEPEAEPEAEHLLPFPGLEVSSMSKRSPISSSESESELEDADDSEQADLIAEVEDLQAALKSAQRREDTLKRQIVDLEADLAQQKNLVQTLQTELSHAHEHKSELEQARKTILQLSDATAKMTQELNALKGKSAPPAKSPTPTSVPAPAPAPSAPVSKSAGSKPAENSKLTLHEQELYKVLQHPIYVAAPSTNFTNEDIGWVD
jgi:myosin heavy subunit